MFCFGDWPCASLHVGKHRKLRPTWKQGKCSNILSIPGKETLMNNKFPNANEIVDVLHACSDLPQMC